MSYDKQYEKDKAKWEATHPNQDYDTYINNAVDEANDN